ncbi:chondroitinase family polysaccharide lyase [Marinifilum sp. D737]|uniref:chondroitinase family polysaccharide lyase n=1 Tax=Marinifilum sp. D737 TaxID=2969628 RepID=UPI002276D75A|nr:chondroitinase family polysaccharide lyase [Marinifilum sp. D737]MCY1634308.1 polysaccharide lyase beta-sandwich domain-containing protein [Marinifilum sp. D737]
MHTKKHTKIFHCLRQVLVVACVLISARLSAQDLFVPEIITFEGERVNSQWSADSKSELQVSERHFKHGKQSLKWTWERKGFLELDQNINFTPFNPEAVDKSIPTFCFWVYNETPKDERITVQFATNETVNCEFEFGLNYKGWRAAWVAFERDMKGTPVTSMNKMKIIAPENTSGSLYFDHIMLCTPADSRWNTPDYQVPFVNAKTENHWLVLYKSSLNKPSQKLEPLTDKQIKGIQMINKRYSKSVIKKVKVTDKLMKQIRKDYAKYKISRSEDQITGENIWFCRFSEIYRPYSKDWKNYFNKLNKGFKKYTKLMFDVACAYNQTDNAEYKSELEELFFNLSDHIIDQGWAEGSANGTLHHLGYSMRTYYSAYFLMRESLIRTQRADQAQKAMEWYSGVKEVFAPFHGKGMSIDAFNTSVMGRLASILMLEDSPEKVRYLKAYVAWIDNGLAIAPGLKDSFKVDGSVFHHANNYPAYATGGYDGATRMVYYFSKTPFHVSEEGHRILKESLLKTRLFCNKETWPTSMSGRHPNGKGKLSATHYELMALSGTPDGKKKIDKDMAAAYLRLMDGKKATSSVKKFQKAGIQAETDPNGNWTMNYAALGIHRRDNWSVTAQGHSRYLWAAEHYIGANFYGRYMKHGQVQILAGTNKPSVFTAGFNVKGWDWGRFAGTTAIHLPIEQLRANILNVDQVTGYEEMLMSDEAFAGAISLEGKNGAWGMKLHEHDKYNGSHRALKSVFFFDEKIICLGSDIENINADFETETTLFQNYLKQESDAVQMNGKEISEFPFAYASKGKKANLLTDNVGNSFYIPSAYTVEVGKQLQHSKDQKKETPNQGNFATAVIRHGKAPKGESYEYAILVQRGHKELQKFAKQMKKKAKAPYTVLQKDSKAHIVRENASKTTAFVLFEANEQINISGVKAVDAPVLVMLKDKKDTKVLSLCDPDLHLYEGPADVVIENGKRKERSIYSRKWKDNESKISKVRISIEGNWSVPNNKYCTLISNKDNQTVLEFSCQHGLTREVELQKK